MSYPVLFIDEVHPSLHDRLEALGYTCVDGTGLDREGVKAALPGCVGAVIRSRFKFDREIIEAGPDLQFIARPGAGLENIDRKRAKMRNIRVINSPEGNRDAVAEQAIGMLLMLFNNLIRADREVRDGRWRREANRGIELKGKTVGLIGYGYVGGAFARRLSGFGVKVIAYDKYKTGFSDRWAAEVDLDTLFAQSDVISLHVPLTDETRHLVNSDWLNRCQPGTYLINTARGPVVKTTDLVAALDSGQLAGACLDVLEFESTSFEALSKAGMPPEFEALTNHDKVILSPHIAGWTHASYRKMSEYLAEKIEHAFGRRN